jgi:hypothetical protein
MALRDKLAERAQPYLEPGEQVRHVFTGQTGPSPWFAALSWWIILFAGDYYVFAVTDRAILVMKAGKFVPTKPKSLEARLPLTQIGPVSGLWAKTETLGKRVWINKRFHKDVEAADAELAARGGAAGGFQPPPPPPA